MVILNVCFSKNIKKIGETPERKMCNLMSIFSCCDFQVSHFSSTPLEVTTQLCFHTPWPPLPVGGCLYQLVASTNDDLLTAPLLL